jgi:hypothetical protein
MGVLTIYRKNSNQLVSQYSSRIPIKRSSQRVALDLTLELSLTSKTKLFFVNALALSALLDSGSIA